MAKHDSVALLKDKIKLLKGARKYVKDQNAWYDGICAGLLHHLSSSSVSYTARSGLSDYITKALEGNIYYGAWLYGNSVEYRNTVSQKERCKAITQGRLAWIDWMIACLKEDLEAKGAKK